MDEVFGRDRQRIWALPLDQLEAHQVPGIERLAFHQIDELFQIILFLELIHHRRLCFLSRLPPTLLDEVGHWVRHRTAGRR